MTDHQPVVQTGSNMCVCGFAVDDHSLARTYLDRVGWYEFIKGGEATTHIAYVYEDGSVYLPEGPDVVDETDFRLVFGTDRCHRLIREREAGPYDEVHLIEFRDDGWTIQHTLTERVDGLLFDCPRSNWNGGDPGLRGRFVLNEDGTIGVAVTS